MRKIKAGVFQKLECELRAIQLSKAKCLSPGQATSEPDHTGLGVQETQLSEC